MTRILLLLFAVDNVLLVISHFLLLFFFFNQVLSYVLSVLLIFFSSQHLFTALLFYSRKAQSSDLSGDGGGRSLYPGAARQMSYWWHLSICEMCEPQRSSSLIHYCQPTLSSFFLSLSFLLSYTSWLYFYRSKV